MDFHNPCPPAILGVHRSTMSKCPSVNRVRNTAMRLSRDLQARQESKIDDLLVELVALFHDMAGASVRVFAPILMEC